MGMYTELNCAFRLIESTPQQVIRILRYMIDDGGETIPQWPNHPLFGGQRWRYMLRCDSSYFDGNTHSEIRFDDTDKSHYVTIRCNLKNYDDEIEKFIHWLIPYISAAKGQFLGYKIYEEDGLPDLLIHPGQWVRARLPPKWLRWLF